jgi:hypothetical protein
VEEVLAPEPIEELVVPITTEVIVNKPLVNNFEETRSVADELVTPPDPVAQDEILQQPSNLTQAAQSVVIPAQDKQAPWSSSGLYIGFIGLGVFALIAGLVVARRGVPGAIAS